jgi:hypothetical protein
VTVQDTSDQLDLGLLTSDLDTNSVLQLRQFGDLQRQSERGKVWRTSSFDTNSADSAEFHLSMSELTKPNAQMG